MRKIKNFFLWVLCVPFIAAVVFIVILIFLLGLVAGLINCMLQGIFLLMDDAPRYKKICSLCGESTKKWSVKMYLPFKKKVEFRNDCVNEDRK